MKKVVLFTMLLLAGIIQAQEDQKQKLSIEKGSWVLGGSFSFGIADNENQFVTSSSENESTSFSFFPNLGYAVGKNLIAGLSLGYSYRKTESMFESDGLVDNAGENELNSWTIAPYIRAFLPVGQRAAFYGQGEIGYSQAKIENRDEISNLTLSETSTNSYSIGIRPGFTYFVSKNFALETRLGFLGYTKTDSDFESDDAAFNGSGESSSFTFDFSSSELFFGLAYYF